MICTRSCRHTSCSISFDFGGVTYKRTPQPNTTQNLPGPEQTISYDTIGRLQQVTNQVNGAYTRYVYANTMTRMDSYATIQSSVVEAHSFSFTDGTGRVIGTAKEHPGSTGGYSGQKFVYDVMGQVIKTSNPTETSASGLPSQWITAGDDAATGWVYKQQTYDWKGRPLVITNQDGTTKIASYSSCGCAGGDVVTLTDEGTLDGGVGKKRQQKTYSDVLGRTIKVELLNWQGGTAYSTTVNTYNARDQITQIRQYAGAEGSGTFQDTTMGYDGYGRLGSRHIPEQSTGTATVYAYNDDDTILSITDARGASATHSYNNRHLLTGVAYSAPAGITPTASATFAYDAAGNRTSMSDGLGTKTYNYDQLSRLMSETRVFTGVGTFTVSYDYNLANQLTKITDAANTTVNYSYDLAGQLTGVTGSDTLVAGVSTYASGFQYRAWGGLKQVSVSTLNSSFSYNSRLQTTNFSISGVVNENYDYYSDGRLSFVHNATDSNFDRALSYDHLGRLTLSGAGGEARNDAGPIPFSETVSYNAFNDITQRETETWGGGYYFDSGSYSNHRRTGSGYDASGRIATIDSRSYSYDAAGRNITMTGQRWTPNGYLPTTTESGFDGDGNRVRENSGSTGSMVLTYYLQSSVLGGAVIEELNSSGQKQIGYVYTPSGTQLATQVVGQNYVQFKQASPLGSTQRGVSTAGGNSRIEFDPVGAIVRTNPNSPADHSGGSGDIPTGGSGSLDGRFSSMANPLSGCSLDGVFMPCSLARRGEGESSYVDYVDPFASVMYRGRRKKPVWVEVDTSTAAVTGYNELTIYAGPGGQFEWVDDPDEVLEVYINQRKSVSETRLTANQIDVLRSDVQQLLEGRKDCGAFVSGLLFTVAQQTQLPLYSERYRDDPLTIIDDVAVQPRGGYFLAPGQGASGFAWGGFNLNTAKITMDVAMGSARLLSVSRGLLVPTREFSCGWCCRLLRPGIGDCGISNCLGSRVPEYSTTSYNNW